MHELIVHRNQALLAVHGALPALDACAQGIKDLYTAEYFIQSLYRYRQFMVFVGGEEGAFGVARGCLQEELGDFFQSPYSLSTTRLKGRFESLKTPYLHAEKEMMATPHINDAENFFGDINIEFSVFFDRHWN